MAVSASTYIERIMIVLAPDGSFKGAHQEALTTLHDGDAVLAVDFVPTKVRSFIVAPDETYAVEDKLICGASVGSAAATIEIATPTSTGPVNPSTLSRASGNLWVSGAFYR